MRARGRTSGAVALVVTLALTLQMAPPAVARATVEATLRGPLAAVAAGRAVDLGAIRTRTRDGIRELAVTVELTSTATPGRVAELAGAGLDVRNTGDALVEGYASPAALRALAALALVRTVRPILAPATSAYVSPAPTIHGAAAWNTAGFTGQGVKVGIIDSGFAGLLERLGTELPASVSARCYTDLGTFSADLADCTNLDRSPEEQEHGTAVAEALTDIAPGVTLYVADPGSQLETTQTVAWMTSNGVRIINASWASLLEGPGDGTSPYVDSAYGIVDQAVAAGALWVNSAGNFAQSSWAGPWTDADANRWLEWSPGDERNPVTLAAGDRVNVALRWTSPASDYALTLWRGDTRVAIADERQALTADPFEVITYTVPASGTYDLAVAQVSGPPDPRLRMMIHPTLPLGHAVATGSLPTPADSRNPGEISVGAVNVAAPTAIEPYSSQGPTSDGRVKPDLVAIACAKTTVAFPSGTAFCGTSEAAPFVAGAAALALEANPGLAPAALADWLRSRATPLGSPSPNNTFGAGLLNLGAVPELVPAAVTFVGPPASGAAGTAFLAQPTVAIVDAQGRRVTTGAGSSLAVTLSLASGTPGAILACDGGLTRAAVGGLASFGGCRTDQPGIYTLRADAATLTGVVSGPFSVVAAGAAPILALTGPSGLTYPAGATFVATFALPAGAGRSVGLQRSVDGGTTWTTLTTGVTDPSGRAAFSAAPRTTARYRAFFAGTPDATIEVSPSLAVPVSARLTLAASIPSGRTLARGTKVTLTATARPVGNDVARGRVRFDLYQRIGTSWRRNRTFYVAVDTNGRARAILGLIYPGSWWVRGRIEPTSTNSASAWVAGYRYLVP